MGRVALGVDATGERGRVMAVSGADWEARFKRSQQRWGNLKVRIAQEIQLFSGFEGQKGAAYANRIAGLKWVLDEMKKSPDVLAEGVKLPAESAAAPSAEGTGR